jgi:hypothetical protein
VAEYFSALEANLPLQVFKDTAACLGGLLAAEDPSEKPWVVPGQYRPVEDGLRIAWLSDLHVSDVLSKKSFWSSPIKRLKLFRSLFQKQHSVFAEPFAMLNLQSILERLVELKVHHVLITGDITMLALPEQFKNAHDAFLNAQGSLLKDHPGPKLSPKLWTILPGNHDVSGSSSNPELKLSEFFDAFEDCYKAQEYQCEFPTHTFVEVAGSKSGLRVELIGMDSTGSKPVQIIGPNAKGQISDKQMKRLSEILLQQPSPRTLRLVALHHHLVNIPYVKSELEEEFMELEESASRKLLNLSCDYGIHGILHGHFHAYSPWFAPIGVPGKISGSLPIIGAPCGTLDSPGRKVQFLELREILRNSAEGPRPALLLYQQSREGDKGNTRWIEQALGVCLG